MKGGIITKVNFKSIDKLMAAKKLTFAELSKKSGVSTVTISRLRRGTQSAKPITIGLLADALGVDVTEIIED